jgi:hypothetical protein
MKSWIALLLCGLSVVAVGCGPSGAKPVKVTGKVNLNGKPVEGAEVTFLSTTGGRSASGKTESDGSFKLTTLKTGDGAVPGDYKVTVTKVSSKSGGTTTDVASGQYGADYGAMMEAAATGNMSKVMNNDVPEKYGKAADSGLKATVMANETNEFEFDLK